MAAEGGFRTDLLYRLNVFPLRVPPLRERGEDVVLLAEAAARRLAARRGRSVAPLTPEDRERLLRYDWPGNVRELLSVIERAWITSPDGHRLNLARALPETPSREAARPAAPPPAAPGGGAILSAAEMSELERANTLRALEACGWKVSGSGGAAERLGLNPNTLMSRMKSLGIRRPRSG
jgi:transcriptional regulator with GAF, ATPase, and Fis domain